MGINEFLLQEDWRLRQLREEYTWRLETIRYLQNHLETQQRDLFEFIAEHQEDFNRLYQ